MPLAMSFCPVVRDISTIFKWITMKPDTNIHGAQRMNRNDFDDPDFSSSATIRMTFVVFSEMSRQLLDG